ncbi:sensor histidine kinase [Streptomyces sp. M92]|uniref:sensor histidine kinase n=1 Tax=Streptomyces sp. M92 TaxID=2944250 RepID=UPI00234ACE5F|nr:ATP-binding protein [Streptomyces sp. M92]WCN05175.1 histidine kinase [Streptomyces sp. M92]
MEGSRRGTDFRLPLLGWATVAFAVGGCGAWAYGKAGASGADLVRDVAVGWSYAGAGLVAWWRRPANPTGRLMLAEGLTWFCGNLQGSGVPLLFALGSWGEALNLAVLGHLLLAFPDGRLAATLDRFVVAAGYGLVAVGGLVRVTLYDPAVSGSATYLSCADCGPDANALLLRSDPGLFHAVDLGYRWAGALLTVVCLGALVRRWRLSCPARRRVLVPAWAAIVVAVAFFAWEVLYVLAPNALGSANAVLTWPSDASQIAVPFAFLTGLLHMRLRRAFVGNLVIEVGTDPTPRQMQDALARVLGDPALRLGLRRSPDSLVSEDAPVGYLDPEGRPVPLPRPGSGLSATWVGDAAGAPAAVLVHDAALDEDETLMSAISGTVRLWLLGSRLRSEVATRAEEARAFQTRLLRAAYDERQRLERDLHDGAQTRLLFGLMALRRLDAGLSRGRGPDPALRQTVAEADRALRQALDELRDLARGIHPAVLTREGLGPAVTALAEQAEIPVLVMVEPGRFAPLTESTAYFVVAEAVANAAKHAKADVVSVSGRRDGDRLVVEVADDGVGGAAPAGGTGLRGLADRVAAAGGTLEVTSSPGRGTRVRAELPCE